VHTPAPLIRTYPPCQRMYPLQAQRVATKNPDIIGHFRSFCVAYQPRLNPIPCLMLPSLPFLRIARTPPPRTAWSFIDNDSFSTLRQPRHHADGKDLVGASRRQKHAAQNKVQYH
jgi:hypothetical protein